MSNDDASAQPRSEQELSASKAHDQKQGSGHRASKILRKLLKGWRALAFLLIVLVSGSYAFHYRALSSPGSESRQLANHAPQEIDFFVNNPSVSVDVNVNISLIQRLGAPEPSSTQDVVNVTLTIHAPSRVKNVTILMLSSAAPEPGESEPNEIPPSRILIFSPFSNLENSPPATEISPEPQIIDRRFATLISGAPSEMSFDEFDYYIGNDIEQTNASLYGHLPAVGSMDQSVGSDPSAPPVLAESYKKPPYQARDIVLEPWIYNPYFSSFFSPTFDPSRLQNPKSYRTPYGGPGDLFYSPAGLSIKETQQGLASAISSQQINYMTPTGKPSGPDYAWQGSTYLEPVFQATNGDALQGESNDAFLSGIIFGIAGAAAIAFVQEIPEKFSRPVWWSRRKRKRRSSSAAATDEKPDSAEAEADAGRTSKTARSSTGLGWPPFR